LEKLRLSLNWRCNLRCAYCRPGGDGAENISKEISIERVIFLAKVFEKVGVKKINLTGGEPTLYKDLRALVTSILNATNLNVTLNTNGIKYVYFKLDEDQSQRLNYVFSIDTLDPDMSREIGRTANIEKLVNNLKKYKSHKSALRVNAVIVKNYNDNLNHFIEFVTFFQGIGIPLKFQSVFDTSADSFSINLFNYTSLDIFKDKISELGYKLHRYKNKSHGVTEPVYFNERTDHEVRFLDKSPASTRYSEFCGNCTQYPCDTGIYAYYVTSDEKLLTCRNRRIPLFDFKSYNSVTDAASDLQNKLNKIGYLEDSMQSQSTSVLHNSVLMDN